MDAKAFRARREELGLGPLVIHANYLINLAAPQPMLRTRSIQGFHDELVRGLALGADFVVVHPGARGESQAVEQAVAMAIESIKQASEAAAAVRGCGFWLRIRREWERRLGRGWKRWAQIVRRLSGIICRSVFGYGAFVCRGI